MKLINAKYFFLSKKFQSLSSAQYAEEAKNNADGCAVGGASVAHNPCAE